MKYSESLIEQVKKLYPNSTEMQHHAEAGNTILGRFLDDSSSGGIGAETILSIHTIEELHQRAKLLKAKQDLYQQWWGEYTSTNK
jgi:hypothetical protein